MEKHKYFEKAFASREEEEYLISKILKYNSEITNEEINSKKLEIQANLYQQLQF